MRRDRFPVSALWLFSLHFVLIPGNKANVCWSQIREQYNTGMKINMRSRLGLQVRSDRATCSGLIKHWRAGARVRGSDESNKVSTNDIQAAVINEAPAIKNSSQTTSQYFGINIRMVFNADCCYISWHGRWLQAAFDWLGLVLTRPRLLTKILNTQMSDTDQSPGLVNESWDAEAPTDDHNYKDEKITLWTFTNNQDRWWKTAP